MEQGRYLENWLYYIMHHELVLLDVLLIVYYIEWIERLLIKWSFKDLFKNENESKNIYQKLKF